MIVAILVLLSVAILELGVLIYKLHALTELTVAQQIKDVTEAVGIKKTRRVRLPAQKTTDRGRGIEKQPELVDLSQVPYEEGIKAVLEAAGVDDGR